MLDGDTGGDMSAEDIEFIERVLWCIPLGIVGVSVTIYNWSIVYGWFIKKRATMWIPILGGGGIGLAFMLCPGNAVWYLFWIAWFLDWGCIPGFVHTLIYYIKNREK